jgi:hypothetical protein
VSTTYLFFAPAQLPLTTDLLSDETVRSFTDVTSVQATLSTHLPALAWDASPEGALAHGTVSDDGALYELSIRAYVPPAGSTASPDTAAGDAPSLLVSLRSSLRVDSASFVQRLCDATGWIAFDDRPRCFQPHHPPIPA